MAGPSSVSVTPTDLVEPLETTHHQVEGQTNQANDDHAGDHQIITLAGVAGVDDQVAQARVDGDHLGGDHDQPRDPESRSGCP